MRVFTTDCNFGVEASETAQHFPQNWAFFGHSTNMAQGQSPWMDGLPFNVQTHIAHMILAQQLLLRPP